MVYSKAIFEKTPQLFLQNLYRGKSIPHNDDPVFLRKKMTTLSKQITKYIKAHLSIGTYDIWDVISSYSENNFIFSSRILQRNQEVLDCRFQFVGCTTERKNCKMTPIHRLDKAPIIYISLGTTHINQKLSFYQKCIDALRNTSYFVVISLSEQIQTSELKNLSSNILLLPYVNQLSILSKAHLFITHGGANGFNEACYYGVPMLVFPQQGDQFDVADRVVELHIGTKANDEAVTCDDLKGLIHDLLSDSSVAQQISCLSSRLKEEHAKSKASDVIVQFIQDMRNI